MQDWAYGDCRRRSWAAATAFGGLVAVMLRLFAYLPLLWCIAIGVGLMLASGMFVTWAFCTGAAGRTGTPPDRSDLERRLPPRDTALGGSGDDPAGFVPETAAAPAGGTTGAPAMPDLEAGTGLPPDPARPGALAPSSVPQVARGAAAKPVPRRTPTERGLLGAVARTHDAAPAPGAAPVSRLAGPRGGRADDLKLIRGIGPVLEAMLNAEGIWHFDQIAAWKARDIAEIDARIGRFRGRITRDEWVRQARILSVPGTARRDAAHDA
ncbi:MAG: hypothetical protein ACOY4T_02600 [Pseudomonadota bacterium]